MNHGDHGRRSHAAERSGADTDRLCISSIRPPLDDQGESSLRVIWARAGMHGEELRNKPHLATPTAGRFCTFAVSCSLPEAQLRG